MKIINFILSKCENRSKLSCQNVNYIVKLYPIIQKNNPIKVKAGNYKKHTSIVKKKYKRNVGTRYVPKT